MGPKGRVGWVVRASMVDGSPDRLFSVGYPDAATAERAVKNFPNVDKSKVKAERLLSLWELAECRLRPGEVLPYV